MRIKIFGKSLSRRLLFTILLVIVVVNTVNFVVISSNLTRQLNNTSQTILQHNTEFFYSVIDTVNDSIKADLGILKSLPRFRTLDPNSTQYPTALGTITDVFTTFAENRKNYYQISYLDISGNEVIKVNYRNNVIDVSTEEELQNRSDQTYFTRTINLAEQEVYVSDFELNKEGNSSSLTPIIRYASPLFDSQNNKLGVILLTAYGEVILNQFENNLKANDGEVFLVDSEGYFIYNADRSKEWGSEEDLNTGENLQKRFSSVGDQILQVTSGFIRNGEGVFSFIPVYLSENNYIIIIRFIPYEIFNDPLEQLLADFLLSTTPLLIVMVIFIAITISRVSSPIKDLALSAEKMASGDFSVRARVNSEDEIGQLATNFNLMADKLEKHTSDLSSESQKKTEELSNKVKEMKEIEKATLNIMEDLEFEKQRVSVEKDKINAILHSIGDGVFVVDKDFKIILFNTIAANLTGYSPEEAIGKNYKEILKFISEESGKEYDKFIVESMSTGTIVNMDSHTMLVNRRGEKIPVSDSAAPLKDTEGRIIGCVVVFKDITKEYEVDKAKTEFVSLASHQLRTPLSAMSWYIEMLMDGDAGKLNEEQVNYLKEVYDSSQRMADLVESLLNVSRIDLGTFIIEPKPTDISEVSKSIVKELKQMIETKKIKVVESYEEGAREMNADEKLIRIVLQNLTSNAVKYTPDEGTVNISIAKDDKGYMIKVADTGYGIPKEQQSKIFGKLFRADNVRQKVTDGNGLGLYIVKSIVEQGGGKVWFESEENKGTTFYVTFPSTGMARKEGSKELTFLKK